jgi:hypothetical protein
MPFCPECSYEYSADTLVCPECGVGLVERLSGVVSSAATKPDDSWIGVCRLGSQLSSQMIRGLLDSNNIPSIIMPSAFQSLGRSAGWMAATGSKQSDSEIVMVPREFYEEAELLLSAVLGEDIEMLNAPKP